MDSLKSPYVDLEASANSEQNPDTHFQMIGKPGANLGALVVYINRWQKVHTTILRKFNKMALS